jgi:putative flippase GtrA
VQLVSFGLNGVSTAIVYSTAAWSLIALSPTTLAFDVTFAYAIAVAAHYLGSRLVFRAKTDLHGHVFRYLAVIAASWLTTAFLAWCLHRTAINIVIAVYLPVAVTAVPTFLLMRNWVFKNTRAVQPRLRRDS